MKAFSDIEQSKKLAKILPIKSADMYYFRQIDNDYIPPDVLSIRPTPLFIDGKEDFNYDIPCWSLSALLDVLPKEYYPVKDHKTDLILGKPKDKWCVLYWDTTGMQHGIESLGDNPVDACIKMIIKLKEKKLL